MTIDDLKWTKARLIDHDALMKAFEREVALMFGETVTIKAIRHFLAGRPTVEAEPVTRGEWISVKDRLPKTDGEILAVLFGRVYMCWYLSATKQFAAPSGNVWDIDDVTHWMLLPEVPKEETK